MANKTVTNDSTVTLHYRGTLDDGTEFDNSHTRGEAMSVTLGEGRLISGFEQALLGMTEGEKKSFILGPENAYGHPTEEAVRVVPKSEFPPDFPFTVGGTVQGERQGVPVIAKIVDQDLHTVTMDFNHPMAGKNLTFNIEVIDIS